MDQDMRSDASFLPLKRTFNQIFQSAPQNDENCSKFTQNFFKDDRQAAMNERICETQIQDKRPNFGQFLGQSNQALLKDSINLDLSLSRMDNLQSRANHQNHLEQHLLEV